MASPQWIDIDAAASIAGVHSRTIRRAAALGELPAYKIGRLLRFRQDEVHLWLLSKRLPNARSGPARTSTVRSGPRSTSATRYRGELA